VGLPITMTTFVDSSSAPPTDSQNFLRNEVARIDRNRGKASDLRFGLNNDCGKPYLPSYHVSPTNKR
jgi:hypothetical protein